MTTTHTFQGLNTESRPSSRVLNPPGGSSSNIFGYGDQPKQQACIRSNSENDKERSDAVLHSAAATAPQQKPGAPRSVFNPITGEMYEKVSQEPPPPGSVSKSAVNYDNIKEVPKSVTSLNNDQLQTGASAPKQRQNQNQGGVFGGGAEDVKEHRSTRVSQPPGGHSTKLW